MATSFFKIASVTVGSGGSSSMTFSSIPQTYTDLKLVISGRSTDGNFGYLIRLNNALSTYAGRWLEGVGTSVSSYTSSNALGGYLTYSTQTANTFCSSEAYIANYTSSSYKSVSIETAQESNSATGVYLAMGAQLWSDTSAITSIVLTINTLFAQHTTATLYGIKKD
jgi:hypothetical protein